MRVALPIDALLPELASVLQTRNRLILRAAPGAGKTTRVPPALMDADLAAGKQVVVLEPRRLAARAAAAFVAHERGTVLGDEVGYRVRYETCGKPTTRLWYLTEGILGRQLTHDPFLEQVGIIVLDEFHERHLPADIALAVCRELQDSVRSDLKLVVMSATLDTERLAAYLGGCRVLTSEGRQYPIRVDYAGDRPGPLSARVTAAIESVLATPDDSGDILVFLPGAAEIRRTAEQVQPLATRRGIDVITLHGDLPLEAQQRAIQRGPRRKLVLSTNVAETSLTIEGITTVIDSGLAREARFDAARGLNTISLVGISQAAASQRAGRAGRLAPGRCLRLGTIGEFQQRRAFETPEVQRLDLSGVVLELRAWGARQLDTFPWPDPPTPGKLARAEQLLVLLQAVDSDGAVTAIGRDMLRLPVEPRLARSLVEARRRDCVADVALLSALASERDICAEQRGLGPPVVSHWESGASDLLVRARLFCEAARNQFHAEACRRLGLDARSVRAVEQVRRHLLRSMRVAPAPAVFPAAADAALRCLLAGYADRLCRRRAEDSRRAIMVGGTGVRLDPSSVVRDAELFVAIDVEGRRAGQHQEALVRRASAVEPAWLPEVFPTALQWSKQLCFDAQSERVVEIEALHFHDLELARRANAEVDRLAAGEILASAGRSAPERALTIDVAAKQLLERLAFLHAAVSELDLPRDSSTLLAAVLESVCQGRRSFAETRRVDVGSTLRATLTAAQREALDREAPAEYRLPTGRLVRIDYAAGKSPAIAVRIQELFGQRRTPRLARARVGLVVQLLAPNGRPVQITDDLESFWTRTYPEVRKVLRGRYPKHAWPEDPLNAVPTARTKNQAARNLGG